MGDAPRPAPEPGYRIVTDTADLRIDDHVRVWRHGSWLSAVVRGKDVNVVVVRLNDVSATFARYLVASKMHLDLPMKPDVPAVGVLDIHVKTLQQRVDALTNEVIRAQDALDRTKAGLASLRNEISKLPRR